MATPQVLVGITPAIFGVERAAGWKLPRKSTETVETMAAWAMPVMARAMAAEAIEGREASFAGARQCDSLEDWCDKSGVLMILGDCSLRS